jgi:endoglucanase
MKYLSHCFLPLAVLLSTLCNCGPNNPEPTPTPTPVAPTAISLTASTFDAAAAGGSQDITITSPARPTVSIPATAKDWLSYSESGVYKDYKLTITLKAAANPSYEQTRSAEVTISATGVNSVKVSVSQATKEIVPDPVLPSNSAVARTKELGLGWNLGNHFDAYGADGVAREDAWDGVLATQATFDGVKAAGFTSVRIPVTWLGHIGEAPEYTLDEVWLNRVYEVVGYAENAGLIAIINTHHDEDHGDAHWLNLAGAVNSEDTNTQIKQEIAAVWTQIANKFKDKGDFLMLESFNELIYGTEWSSTSNTEKKCDVINQWNQVFVDAVRATGGNNQTRWLGVPGYAASPTYLNYLKVPNDPAKKTMLAFHCYDPYNYTIGDAQLPDWGHTGKSYPSGEEELKTLFNSIYTNYIAKDIPIYMGEFGCSIRNKADAKAWAYYLYYMEYYVKCFKTYGISGFLWDNGSLGEGGKGYGKESHPYIHHGTGEYMTNGEEPVKAMMKAWNTTDATYTLQFVYDSAPTF